MIELEATLNSVTAQIGSSSVEKSVLITISTMPMIDIMRQTSEMIIIKMAPNLKKAFLAADGSEIV